MGRRVHLAEPVHRDQGVDLGGRDRRVTKQFLDDADVGAAVEHVGGERVAQRVRGHLWQAGALGGGVQHAPGALPGQAPAAGVQEHRRGDRDPACTGGQGGPGPDQVGLQGSHRVTADRDDPLLAALPGQPDHRVHGGHGVHGGGVQVQFVHVQAGRFGDPGPGPVQELEQGPVPQHPRVSGRIVGTGAGGGEQAFHLGQGDRLGQAPRRRRRLHVTGRIGLGQALRGRERMQAPDRDHRPGRRTDR